MTLTPRSGKTDRYWDRRNEVVGAFWDVDFVLFDLVLDYQSRRSTPGDLLEIGALYGRSAIVLGLHLIAEQRLFVCDIFEDVAHDEANQLENDTSYANLSRAAFELNFQSFVARDPVIIQEFSTHITDHVPYKGLRFAHVDGSHLHSEVREDITSMHRLLGSGGVLCLDDYRALHTPGVAGAAWAAVAELGLLPVVLTEQKMYATWDTDTADELLTVARQWARRESETMHSGVQEIAGREVLIVQNPPSPPPPASIPRRVARRILRRSRVPFAPDLPFLGKAP